MRVVIVYREQSEHRMAVESFMRDFTYQTGQEIETLDPDSREGMGFCQTYDIVEYPTIIALGPDGTVANMWRGANLPSVNEVQSAVIN